MILLVMDDKHRHFFLKALMEWLDMNSIDTRKLRIKLAALERTARERSETASVRLWDYVGGVDPVTQEELTRIKEPVSDELYFYLQVRCIRLLRLPRYF